jgi:hypothetical protein
MVLLVRDLIAHPEIQSRGGNLKNNIADTLKNQYGWRNGTSPRHAQKLINIVNKIDAVKGSPEEEKILCCLREAVSVSDAEEKVLNKPSTGSNPKTIESKGFSMPITSHTEIVEDIVLKRLPEIVRHYDRNSERTSRAVSNAVKAIIDIPAAMTALGSKTPRLAIQVLTYTAHRMMDTSVMNASGARYLLQRSLENIRIPDVIEEFKTKFSKAGERTRAPTIEGLKITLDTRKVDRPGLDIQDLSQVKELMAMSRRLGPKPGTETVRKSRDTTPAPALTVMADAEAAKEESRMAQSKSNLECCTSSTGADEPQATGCSHTYQPKFVTGDLAVVVRKESTFYKQVVKITRTMFNKVLNCYHVTGIPVSCEHVDDPVAFNWVPYLNSTHLAEYEKEFAESDLKKYDPLKVHFPEDGVIRGQDSSMVVIDETENPPPIGFTNGKQPPEVDLAKSMAGVDLVGAMVDQAAKDINECMAPSSLRISYARTLVARMQKLKTEIEVNQRELDRLVPELEVGQVWEDSAGNLDLIVQGAEDTGDKYAMRMQKPFDRVFIGGELLWKHGLVFVGYIDELITAAIKGGTHADSK